MDVYLCILRATHYVGCSWRQGEASGLEVNVGRNSMGHCCVQMYFGTEQPVLVWALPPVPGDSAATGPTLVLPVHISPGC